jgi:protein SCO1/2
MAGGAMNNPARARHPGRLLAAALLLGLGACNSAPPAEPPLAGARLGGPFTLTDQNGRQVSDTAFAGRYRMVYFGYTFCPDVCPTALQHLMQGLKAFAASSPAQAAKIQPIFITVDPARDTPAVLKQYVAAFDPRLIGLTGSEAQIADVAKRYGVFYQRAENAGSSDYLMDHMSQAILFDPDGKPLALLPQEQDGAAIAAELAKWVR